MAMKKRFTAILLAFVLVCVLLPVTAAAANASSVTIGSVTLNAANPYYINGASGAQGTVSADPNSDWNAYFDSAKGELTLKNLNLMYTGTGTGADNSAVYGDGDLKIILAEGTNNFVTAENAQHVIYSRSPLTFSGSGNLSVTGGKNSTLFSYGNLTINCTGNLTIKSTQGTAVHTIGVYIKISAGTVNFSTSAAKYTSFSGAGTSLDISGDADVTISSTAQAALNRSLFLSGKLTLSDNAVLETTVTNNDAGNYSLLITSGISISGSAKMIVNATIHSNQPAVISGGILLEDNGSFEVNSTGKGIEMNIPGEKVFLIGGSLLVDSAAPAFTNVAPTIDPSYSYEFRSRKTDNYVKGGDITGAEELAYFDLRAAVEPAVSTPGTVHQVTEVSSAPSTEEENPNTGAEAPVSVVAAVAVLSAAVLISKKR